MSRSYRKTPVISNACADSDKYWKQKRNRAFRQLIKEKLKDYEYLEDSQVLPAFREVSNVWNWDKDGKQWAGFYNNIKELQRK
jgi:hypothetical protein